MKNASGQEGKDELQCNMHMKMNMNRQAHTTFPP